MATAILLNLNLEVLPAYWGIETRGNCAFDQDDLLIWKYYPPTGVLKLRVVLHTDIRNVPNLEVLPAYWGIETSRSSCRYASHS